MPGLGPWETETDAGDRRRWKRWFGTLGERERWRSICRPTSKNWSRPDTSIPNKKGATDNGEPAREQITDEIRVLK